MDWVLYSNCIQISSLRISAWASCPSDDARKMGHWYSTERYMLNSTTVPPRGVTSNPCPTVL